MKYYIQYIAILILCFFPLSVVSQTIEFKISDCIVYINEEINLEETRSTRNRCKQEDVLITFYPDTDAIELELDMNELKDRILRLQKDSFGNYSTILELDDLNINIDLKLNRLFGYIRGGKLSLEGKNYKENHMSVMFEFERK
ncbi:hypothetical protein [Gracilimonas mengyeensis]|uniref:Uncharacterized protein n=1 Tax=Gracilimonas mengyeensis TaxID=1302730 RepID=A0A521EVE4_9BACT|nr:hypothetical protein [Gracilimonas mengyeensis]SMO87080.1 hypothetical protein SAMN06265219_113127 [Gracilimonas mengyeensis]